MRFPPVETPSVSPLEKEEMETPSLILPLKGGENSGNPSFVPPLIGEEIKEEGGIAMTAERNPRGSSRNDRFRRSRYEVFFGAFTNEVTCHYEVLFGAFTGEVILLFQ